MFGRRTSSGNNPRQPRESYGIGRETPAGDNPPINPIHRTRPLYYVKPLVLKLVCQLSEEDFKKEEERLKENYPGPVILLKQYEEFVTEKDLHEAIKKLEG